jgi:formate/nitrite transporter FocA (FNT family)
MTFIVCGFEHSIANMYYLFIGLVSKSNPTFVETSHISQVTVDSVNLTNIIKNLIPVTIGNIIGGTVFVGLTFWVMLKYNRNEK